MLTACSYSLESYTHGLAKYLSDVLKPLINHKFTIKDSFSFVHELLSVRDIPFMCSFDVISLYTNIPDDQTIEISLNKLYNDNNTVNYGSPLVPKQDIYYNG